MTGRLSLKWLVAFFVAALVAIHPAARADERATASPERQILVMVRHPPEHFRPNHAYGGGYGDELARSAHERLARRIAAEFGLVLVHAWPMPIIGLDCFVMSVPEGRSHREIAAEVSRHAEVEWAQPVELFESRGRAVPINDPLYRAQPAARLWQLGELHKLATGRGMRIAIVDTGVDSAHPDLAGQVSLNRNFVTGGRPTIEQHGTGVAGIIGAKASNGVGIAGIAPGARILALRACWERGSGNAVCDSFSLVKSVYFALEQKADVVNLSLSGPDDRLLRKLLQTALARGSAVVAAFDDSAPGGGFPASLPGVVAVSDHVLATARGGVYTAPGRDVPTTQPGGRWFLVNGSSYAAAHVSGLLALVRERQGAKKATLVSARPGGGEIDACATLARAAACDCSCPPALRPTAAVRH